MKYLTMAEMAAELRRSTKTFRQEVTDKRIPFYAKGKRGKLFDPAEVKAHLRQIDEQERSRVQNAVVGPAKLTLAEIADIYHQTPKTFARHVRQLGIPHERLGVHMLFDPVAVKIHLDKHPEPDNVVKFTPRKKGTGSRFAAEVGI